MYNTLDSALPEGSVSRRRVLHAAAWATPAIVIATAAPAAAASTEVPGGIVLASTSGIQDATVFTVRALPSFVADAGGQPTAPVSGVTATIRIATDRVTGVAASTSSAGWAVGAKTSDATYTYFSFHWQGAPLTATSPATELVASIPKTASIIAATAQVTAHGTSKLMPVSSPPANVAIRAFSLMTFNWGPQADVNLPNVVVQGAIINLIGAPNHNTADVVGVTCQVTVPTSATTSGAASDMSNNWNYVGRTTNGSNTVFSFSLKAGTLPTSYNATAFVFHLPRAASANNATYTMRFTGTSPDATGAVSTLQASVVK